MQGEVEEGLHVITDVCMHHDLPLVYERIKAAIHDGIICRASNFLRCLLRFWTNALVNSIAINHDGCFLLHEVDISSGNSTMNRTETRG